MSFCVQNVAADGQVVRNAGAAKLHSAKRRLHVGLQYGIPEGLCQIVVPAHAHGPNDGLLVV
ncbi:hypothetical protein SDC9_110567 [bioreactor metagenome]|uniref:Uncharacterized protein n=1 Tax=bioreactor metagenome TaxID=1076179 RepID=A0A645BF01_9ZZZZ